MTEQDRIISAIAYALKEAYGDAALTPLDYEAARKVYERITELGMVPLSACAAIIASAGGKVTVPHDLLIDPPTEVMRIDELDGITLKVKVPTSASA